MVELLKPSLKFRNLKITGKYPNWRLAGEEADTRFKMGDGSLFWCNFMGDFKLIVIRQALRNPTAARKIWARQDGMPGISPEQCEWDWSAIRDSSKGAVDEMYNVAKKFIDLTAFKKVIKAAVK